MIWLDALVCLLMVVVAIIGVMAGALVLSVSLGNEEREQEQEAQRLSGLIGLLREEALSAVGQAVHRSAITPWFCRSFSQDNQTWYINAGKASGLETGTLLKVIAGGKLVKAPSGVPAGWIPGEVKGTLRVDDHFGRDLAVCSLVNGLGPGEGDLLIK